MPTGKRHTSPDRSELGGIYGLNLNHKKPTLKLLDASQPGRVEEPVGERLVPKRDAAELLPAVHIPGPHTHADFPGLGVLVEILTHALQHFRRG